ncbi:MAG TPA: hypothetical protein PLD47_13880 [Aggregatilineales bacterium]|nr:hypothetical protein [Aggregatilineales bacterium]
MIALSPDADPALRTALTESKITQAFSQLAPVAGRPQPTEILHFLIALDGDKALLEARWFSVPADTDVIAVVAESLGIDPLIVQSGMTVTIFSDKTTARAYFEANQSDYILRFRVPAG